MVCHGKAGAFWTTMTPRIVKNVSLSRPCMVAGSGQQQHSPWSRLFSVLPHLHPYSGTHLDIPLEPRRFLRTHQWQILSPLHCKYFGDVCAIHFLLEHLKPVGEYASTSWGPDSSHRKLVPLANGQLRMVLEKKVKLFSPWSPIGEWAQNWILNQI